MLKRQLNRNPRLLADLPTPFLSLASHQTTGRGRGGNTWVSPAGCLQYSLLLRVSLSQVPASKLVFVQYLFALAVVEACRHENILGKVGEAVKLKWPNDIYIVDEAEKRKVGGILVNTSFTGGTVSIVIGKDNASFLLNSYSSQHITTVLRRWSECSKWTAHSLFVPTSLTRGTAKIEYGENRRHDHGHF